MRATCGQTEFISTSSRGSFLRGSRIAWKLSTWSLRREVRAFSLREVTLGATIKLAYGHSGRVRVAWESNNVGLFSQLLRRAHATEWDHGALSRQTN